MLAVVNFLNTWWPWFNILTDSFILYFLLCYLLFIFYTTKNVFYVVFYLFLIVLMLGLILSVFQVELFTGFLWTIECVVIFALLLLLFFFKTTGTFAKILHSIYMFKYSSVLFFILVFVYYTTKLTLTESIPTLLNTNDLWDNYYEALFNSNINDFTTFLISYYTYNSLELLLIGLVILIASLVCVNLNRLVQKSKIQNIGEFLATFNFFKNYVSFSFMRQQNLPLQTFQATSTRIFKKKIS